MHIDPRRTAFTVALVLIAATPFAWGQQPAGKKKAKKCKADSDCPSEQTCQSNACAPAPSPPDPAPTEPPAPPPPPPPAESAAPPAKPVEYAAPSTGEGTMTDVTEKSGQHYIFIGLRYRGDVVPAFMEHLFVSGGKTFYSNMIGVEADIRKDNFSLIPAISYATYGTGGGVLFLQKGKDDTDPGNWSEINSSMKALYFSADLMWSTKVHRNIDFEYGAGFGVGVMFGSLIDNWVTPDPNGPLKTNTGPYPSYSACQTTTQGPGCATADHQNATIAKVANYTEPSWINGGSKPNFWLWLSVPQIGLRFKPIKSMEARLQTGFSIATGFWFGLSADYGLEQPEKKK
jgi:hypothetical protein